jgi:hypothetical protein
MPLGFPKERYVPVLGGILLRSGCPRGQGQLQGILYHRDALDDYGGQHHAPKRSQAELLALAKQPHVGKQGGSCPEGVGVSIRLL